jgi:hypothetical protein
MSAQAPVLEAPKPAAPSREDLLAARREFIPPPTLAPQGYDGRKGPKMATRGGRKPEGTPLRCVECGLPLGQKGSTPAVKVRQFGLLIGYAHAGCQ